MHFSIQKRIRWNLCNPTPEISDILWHLTKIYSPKVVLLSKIKPEYSDILHNQTHFPRPLMRQIRQVPLYKVTVKMRQYIFFNFKFHSSEFINSSQNYYWNSQFLWFSFKSFDFVICWRWVYLIKVIPEMCVCAIN